MNFSEISFIYYVNKVGEQTDTHKVDFSLFNAIAKSSKIIVPADTNLSEVAWVMRGICLAKRSFLDRLKDVFSFLGYESSMEKADRLYYSVVNIYSERF